MEIYISVCLAPTIVSQLFVSGGISVNATLIPFEECFRLRFK